MSNEEMAIMIKEGQKELITALWENVRKFAYMYCNRFYDSNTELCKAADVELEDLKQESFFAFLKAVESYEPEKGYKLLTYMTYHLRNVFKELTGIRKNKCEGLNSSYSLHTPINDDIELIETIADNSEDIAEVERRLYNETLRTDLDNALELLPHTQSCILKEVYYKGLTVAETAGKLNITESKARGAKETGLRELRRNKTIRQYRDDVISRYAYRGGFRLWKHSGYSSTEWTAFKLLDKCKL